jgi:asparagine synthase (glutamine-hydrolysing)
MCGIFGAKIKNKNDIQKARRARDTLIHRGPDGFGEYIDEQIYIGHRRLSILDLSANGAQPMTDRDVSIAANGEIYNFLDLKTELQKEFAFKSNSDSEVILYGYKKWGIDGLLERVEGMYAFAIYDSKIGKLFLARDRIGIKPLYYYFDGDDFAFASELKGITAFIENLELDNTAIYDFLTYLYIPTPKSLYKNCFKLPPAHYLEFDIASKNTKLNCYWTLSTKTTERSLDEAKDELLRLLQKSIKEQLISDVPIGFFLSGGIDSSAVASIASQVTSNIHTYSIGFDVEEFSETKFAKIVADIIKSNHEEQILTFEKTKELFGEYTKWYDEPHADTSAFPTFLVSEFAKSSSTVVLTGDGGDELFGGYEIYKRFEKRLTRQTPSLFFARAFFEKINARWAEKIVENFLLDDLEIYATLGGAMKPRQKAKYKKELGIAEDYDDYWYYRKFYKRELEPKSRLQYMEFNTSLHDDMLTKVDRTSMAVSLETRVPLLATKIVEFAFSLPPQIRYCNGWLKGILKYSLADILPHEILHRKKKGFGIPLGTWGFKSGKHKSLKILEMFNLKL